MNEIRFIDLFSGIGGFRLGLERSNQEDRKYLPKQGRAWINYFTNGNSPSRNFEKEGGRKSWSPSSYRCVWSNDFNKYANQVYTKQFGEEDHHSADIRRINPENIPDFDLLCAGFPCQAFSVAGQRKGFQDTRGTLFFEICRIAEAKRPSLLLLENVKGLLNHDGGRTFTVILQTLDELGYWVEWQVLNSKYFGVPQNRERVFIVGHLRGTGRREIFPVKEGNRISSKEFDRGEGIASSLDANYFKGARRQRTFIISRIPLKFLGRNERNWLKDEAYCVDSFQTGGVLKNQRIRRLTPIECERLQGFPDGWTEYGIQEAGKIVHDEGTDDEWVEYTSEPETVKLSDTQRYRVLGNAVTVNVIEFLGELIKSLFTNKDGDAV